jgi:OOP family OmpA-OmpF porin
MASSLEERFLPPREYNPNAVGGTSNDTVIKELLDKGYVHVYFNFKSTTPQNYSLEAINYLKVYLTENPNASTQLAGYADELGNPAYNKNLSAKRADKVYDILVASRVSANRLSHTGNGEDTSVNKNSTEAHQLVKRVTFKLI